MKCVIVVPLCIIFATIGMAQEHWWSGGDGYGRTGLSSERNTGIPDSRVYDDFDVPMKATVRGAWGNFLLLAFTPANAYYEIRSGISEGNGGTLHAAGEMPVVVSVTGRSTQGFTEYLVRGQFAQSVTLEPGRYWLTVAPIGQGSGRCFVSDTNGKDERPDDDPTPPPMGTPRKNHNSFIDSAYFGYNFADTQKSLGFGNWDFAFGVGPGTGPPIQVSPARFEVTYGRYVEGKLEDLFRYDGRSISIEQSLHARISAPNAELVIEGTAPSQTIGYLGLTFMACVNAMPRDAIVQRLSFFDFASQTWVTADESPAGKYGCDRTTPCVTFDVGRFVEPGTRRIRAALSYFDRGSAVLNWRASIEQAYWVTEPR